MQVFQIKPLAPYSYGVALVAARDKNEAINIYCSDYFRNYLYDDLKCECDSIAGLDYKTDNPMLLFNKIGLK
jgi:hypothetical protein